MELWDVTPAVFRGDLITGADRLRFKLGYYLYHYHMTVSERWVLKSLQMRVINILCMFAAFMYTDRTQTSFFFTLFKLYFAVNLKLSFLGFGKQRGNACAVIPLPNKFSSHSFMPSISAGSSALPRPRPLSFAILQPSQTGPRFLQICKGEDKSALIPTVNHCAKRFGPSCTAPEGGRVMWARTVDQNRPHRTELWPGGGLRGEQVPANAEKKLSPCEGCF